MTSSTPSQRARVRANDTVESASPRQVQAQLSQEDQLRLFQALDVMQKEKAEAEQRTSAVLDAVARENQMVERLRQLRQAQGQEVDEDDLRAAVRATREPTNLVYEPAADGLGRRLAHVYLARAKWLPATMAALLIALVSAASIGGVSHWREQTFQSTVASSQQQHDKLFAERGQMVALSASWPGGLGQDVFKARFDRAMGEAEQTLVQVSTLLSQPSREAIDQVGPLLAKSQSSIALARDIEKQSQEQVSRVKWAQSPAAQVIDASWPEITARAKIRHAALLSALATGNLEVAREEESAIQALSKASSMRSSLREAALLVPAVGQAEAQAARARGEAALLDADLSAATEAMTSLRSITDAINTSYTMKIVNEDGVKSGLWRHPNNNPNARNYYVVVDALDAAGNPVKVKVVNEETGKSETVSRFAVRVSEAEYEKVKADKMDNGLIENSLVGTKRAGVIKPDFNIDTAGGGIITNW